MARYERGKNPNVPPTGAKPYYVPKEGFDDGLTYIYSTTTSQEFCHYFGQKGAFGWFVTHRRPLGSTSPPDPLGKYVAVPITRFPLDESIPSTSTGRSRSTPSRGGSRANTPRQSTTPLPEPKQEPEEPEFEPEFEPEESKEPEEPEEPEPEPENDNDEEEEDRKPNPPDQEPPSDDPDDEPETTPPIMSDEKDSTSKFTHPKAFNGDRKETLKFITACKAWFDANDTSYKTEKHKVLYVIGRMKEGIAESWADQKRREWYETKDGKLPSTVKEFFTEIETAFKPIEASQAAITDIQALHQTGTAEEYVGKFTELASLTGDSNLGTLRSWFLQGLRGPLKEKVVGNTRSATTIQEYYDIAVSFDQAWRESQNLTRKSTNSPRNRQVRATTSNNQSNSPNRRLSEEERARYRREGLCYRCGQKGHIIPNCPSRDQGKPNPGKVAQMKAMWTSMTAEERAEFAPFAPPALLAAPELHAPTPAPQNQSGF